jgi:RNA polymerase sigma factor (sigma-70 family)
MGSISAWINKMRSGDVEAAGRIWERYGPPLTNLARKQLPIRLRSIVDGDDLANDALCVVVIGFKDGRWPDVHDRNHLWGLLTKITYRMACNEYRKSQRSRRPPIDARVELGGRNEPTARPPEIDAIASEQFEILIERLRLKEEILKPIALLIYQGYTYAEIARRLQCSKRKVARKVQLIRLTLEPEGS